MVILAIFTTIHHYSPLFTTHFHMDPIGFNGFHGNAPVIGLCHFRRAFRSQVQRGAHGTPLGSPSCNLEVPRIGHIGSTTLSSRRTFSLWCQLLLLIIEKYVTQYVEQEKHNGFAFQNDLLICHFFHFAELLPFFFSQDVLIVAGNLCDTRLGLTSLSYTVVSHYNAKQTY